MKLIHLSKYSLLIYVKVDRQTIANQYINSIYYVGFAKYRDSSYQNNKLCNHVPFNKCALNITHYDTYTERSHLYKMYKSSKFLKREKNNKLFNIVLNTCITHSEKVYRTSNLTKPVLNITLCKSVLNITTCKCTKHHT